MVKKLPLIISTLAILSSLVTIPSASAINDEGPWSFDQLFLATTELKAIVDSGCPTQEYFRSACVTRIMEARGGIYYLGLPNFQYAQFSVASIDFSNDDGTSTLEYYLRSEDLYRNYNWRLPYDDFLSRLYIVQLEIDHGDNYVSDIKNGIEEPYWRVLYDGTKTDEEDSLLPYDERATLTIKKPSFSPEYEKYIRYYYVDTNGDAEFYTLDFTHCKDGRKYNIWYDTAHPYAYFRDFGYEEGFEDGYNEGNAISYNDGYTNGYEDGFNTGNGVGFEEGYSNGFEDGYSTATYELADTSLGGNSLEEDETEDETGNDTFNENNEDSPELPAENEETPKTNLQIEEKITSNTGAIKVSNSLKLKTPNTGSFTRESYSAEFPWWLGLLCTLGILALIWLMLPNRSRSRKNSKKTLDKIKKVR
ncbi:hypothetical protein IKG33_00005 [Candidatus Saccharibacteria bacterium]|nr:hypothetical protein [Candidatus Saccharibacteria bacterium]